MFLRSIKMATEQAAKRLKPNDFQPCPLIGTHNGHFHADEALAVYLLRLLPTYNPSNLVRTRDPAVLSTCHTVVDVGGEYTPQCYRFDHHQRTFSTTFPSRPTKLSSAGLVYMHFGKAIIAQHTKLPEESQEVGLLYQKLYLDFVEALDANDNGISAYDPATTKGLEKRFNDSGVSLGALVGDLNWHYDEQDEQKTAEQAQAEEDKRFLEASSLMGRTFVRKLDYSWKAWLPARNLVRETYTKRQEWDDKGRIMLFSKGCPWKDHLYTIEAEDDSPALEKVLYVLYPENENEDSKWRIQAVAVSKDSFESRKALPQAWRGVRDDELSKLTGIEGCIFVHASGFIGGNATKAGALQMAQKALGK